jgi:hypothetical protein
MPEFSRLTSTVGALRSASALTETTFLQVGQTLETSIGILSNLTSSFETVLTELRGENLAGSIKALGGAAARVADLGRGRLATSAEFDRLQRAGEAIAGRISRMNQCVKAVDSLVINARIAASAIRASEIDFTTFAVEIARTADMTRTTLDRFGAELQTLRKRVAAAHAGQLVFESRQDEATRLIPERLNTTVNSIPLQHRRAAQAISAMRQRSEQVRQQICTAVLALQAGDVARQRLEHADHALGLLTETAEPSGVKRPHQVADHPAVAETTRPAFAIITCRLQSAQLSDAAERLAQDVRRITASLNNLATEARTLRTLAGSAYGASGRDQGTFIVELETQVGQTLALFTAFGNAQAEASGIMASVSSAAESLCHHLRTVQSLEADIRIMGLNTTLKCARVGPEGRALGLIAQELRAYGNEFAREADALMGEVGNLAEVTRLIASKEADTAPLIIAAMQAMTDALTTLQQVGETLGSTLSALERDSDHVALLLDSTATDLAGQDEIGKALRQAVSALHEMSPPGDLPIADLTPRDEQMLDLMARDYTMANERVIHDRVLGRTSGPAPARSAPVQSQLEDMLF